MADRKDQGKHEEGQEIRQDFMGIQYQIIFIKTLASFVMLSSRGEVVMPDK